MNTIKGGIILGGKGLIHRKWSRTQFPVNQLRTPTIIQPITVYLCIDRFRSIEFITSVNLVIAFVHQQLRAISYDKLNSHWRRAWDVL